MPTFFDILPSASFDGLRFPWDDLSITGRYRHHVHEYRHTDGGDIEKQGRSLYLIRFSAIFDENLDRGVLPNGAPGYPSIMTTLKSLVEHYESGAVAELVIPTFGKMQALLTNIDRKATAQVLSGERVQMEFLESRGVVLSDIIAEDHGVDAAATKFAEASTQFAPGLFDAINSAANAVISVRDQVGSVQSQIAAKALYLVQLCHEADRTAAFFKGEPTAENVQMKEALHELWSVGQKTAQSAQSASTSRIFVVPRLMTIQEISVTVYGRADFSMDILARNIVQDAFAIPPGTQIVYPVDDSHQPNQFALVNAGTSDRAASAASLRQ